MRVGEETGTPPRPPKPDRRVSRLRLSGQWLPMGWLRHSSRDVQRPRTSRASACSDHPFQGGPLVADSLCPGEAHSHRRAQPCSTTSALGRESRLAAPTTFLRPFAPPVCRAAQAGGRYPLPSYYGRADPDRPFRRRRPWFPDSRPLNFPTFRLQPSTVLDQPRSTPSTLAALFCSGFALQSKARQNRRPNRVHSVGPCGPTPLRTGGSLPLALHPGVSPRCSYFQLLALQCRPSQGLSPCCSSALSGARPPASPPNVTKIWLREHERGRGRRPGCL